MSARRGLTPHDRCRISSCLFLPFSCVWTALTSRTAINPYASLTGSSHEVFGCSTYSMRRLRLRIQSIASQPDIRLVLDLVGLSNLQLSSASGIWAVSLASSWDWIWGQSHTSDEKQYCRRKTEVGIATHGVSNKSRPEEISHKKGIDYRLRISSAT
jgi:hypothetical protein